MILTDAGDHSDADVGITGYCDALRRLTIYFDADVRRADVAGYRDAFMPRRLRIALTIELVGFDRLRSDLRAGTVPAFALVVPNQCNEMHGVDGPKSSADCAGDATALIHRGDTYLKSLIDEIQASPIWTTGNTAIVVTFDENDKAGRIPTIVITNNGPRGVHDPTQYDHYSLLRTIEDAFGLDGHLRHVGDPGVQAMTPLFALR